MITALKLTIAPFKTWNAIAEKDRSLPTTLLVGLLPAVAVASAAEGLGMLKLGNNPDHLDFSLAHRVNISLETMLRYECGQALITVLTVFLLAVFFHLILRSFHCKALFRHSFALTAFSFGPILLLQAVDGLPWIPTWICRIIGALLAVKVFYLGLGRVIRPDPSTALGIYFIGALLIFAFAGISHFVGLQIIEGNLFAQWFTGTTSLPAP